MSRRTPEEKARRRTRRRRRLLVLLAVLALGCGVLVALDDPVRTPVGARGVGHGTFPVVEVAGLGSTGENFARLTRALRDEGTPVLDFEPDRPGIQPLTYRPDPGVTLPELATTVVEPAIRDALRRGGYDPDTQVVDVVAHSMGGLLVRYLVEHPVARWAAQVDDLVMVATPNHGSDVIHWETHLRADSPFAALGDAMSPGSDLLTALGTSEPPGEVYTAIGGDPWIFRWYRHGDHGFDDQVPTESVFMTGAALDTFGHLHGKLLPSAEVVSLITRTLRAS